MSGTRAAALQQILERMPDTDFRSAVEQVAAEDPVIWSLLYRKLRGFPLLFDNSLNLTKEALAKAKREARDRQAYVQDVKSRLLRHRPFLEQPLRDTHPHKIYMKGRQVGVSELELIEIVWFLATHPGTKAITTFPRDPQLKQFSETRITPAFNETARMQALLGVPNQVYTKKIGESFLILRSAWESNLGEGVDADMVVLDEKDRMESGVEGAFRESLSSSKWGLLREVSTPTLPDQGVALVFAASDQQAWLVRCSRCGLEQEILWPDNIVQVKDFPLGCKELPEDSYEYQCRLSKCRGLLDRMRGRWVARKPGVKNIRGYHIPQLIAPWISATEVMQKKIDLRFLQLWLNYVLGLPAMGDNVLLTEEDWENACAEHRLSTFRTSDWQDVVVGIDWGHFNWVTVLAKNVLNGKNYVIGIKIFEDNPRDELRAVKDIHDYLLPFDPDLICPDDGYGKDRNAYLLRVFGEGKVFAVRYNPAPKSKGATFNPQWSSDELARVLADRTMTLKLMCRAIKEREIGLPSYDEEEAALLKQHVKNLVLIKDQDEKTKEIYEEFKSKGPDHLAHSLALGLLGLERLQKTSRFSFTLI